MPRTLNFSNLISDAYLQCGGLDNAAEIMEVSRATANRWRKNGSINKMNAIKRLAGKIGWPIEWFAIGRKN
jgi:hypothetical protein